MRILFSKNLILPLHSTPHVCAINKVVDEENVVAGDGSAEEVDEAKLVATADNGKAFNGDHTLFPQHSKKNHQLSQILLELDAYVQNQNGSRHRRSNPNPSHDSRSLNPTLSQTNNTNFQEDRF
jgi:hypothetical protein